jgi:Pyruvate/2-oxoacid:ferredoxin oxidoreductase gamma subunit
MMGAVARVLDMPPLEDVVAAIRDEVPGDAERNVTAAREAYEAVQFAQAVKPAA